MYDGVFNAHNNATSGHGIIIMLPEHFCITSTSAPELGWNHWGYCCGSLSADRLTAQPFFIYWKVLYLRCMQIFLYLCGRGCVFSMMELQHTVGKSPAMVECDISRMLD
jgi:hypothetical protein